MLAKSWNAPLTKAGVQMRTYEERLSAADAAYDEAYFAIRPRMEWHEVPRNEWYEWHDAYAECERVRRAAPGSVQWWFAWGREMQLERQCIVNSKLRQQEAERDGSAAKHRDKCRRANEAWRVAFRRVMGA